MSVPSKTIINHGCKNENLSDSIMVEIQVRIGHKTDLVRIRIMVWIKGIL